MEEGNEIYEALGRYWLSSLGIQVGVTPETIWAQKNNKVIQLSLLHGGYFNDIVSHFDHYFESVHPKVVNDFLLVDFSKVKFHNLVGFDLIPIMFPALSEPISTTQQYLEFADLKNGDVCLDLGAYAGVSSILMKEEVGNKGVVVAVEADAYTLPCLRRNIKNYFESCGKTIELVEAAVWNHNDGISFNSHGNMGSGGYEGGSGGLVNSCTISEIVEKFKLNKLDFVKCDVEGAEGVIFDDFKVFERLKPKVIIEVHEGHRPDKLVEIFSSNGFFCEIIDQKGCDFPLVQCKPSSI